MAVLWKVQTVVTGVAGAPYYMTGYFNSAVGAPQGAVTAWHRFCTQDNDPAGFLTAATYTTGSEVSAIESSDGTLVGRPFTVPIVLTGTNTGERLPYANQILVRWGTGAFVGGREIRGRTFIPLRFESENDLGNVSDATVASWNARAAQLVNEGSVEHVIWSKSTGASPPTTSGSANKPWSVLRSRRD